MKQITFEQWNELALMTLDVGETLREVEKSPASFQYFADGTVRKKASFAHGFVCDGAWDMPGTITDKAVRERSFLANRPIREILKRRR